MENINPFGVTLENHRMVPHSRFDPLLLLRTNLMEILGEGSVEPGECILSFTCRIYVLQHFISCSARDCEVRLWPNVSHIYHSLMAGIGMFTAHLHGKPVTLINGSPIRRVTATRTHEEQDMEGGHLYNYCCFLI
jgi:hypothetical protein